MDGISIHFKPAQDFIHDAISLGSVEIEVKSVEEPQPEDPAARAFDRFRLHGPEELFASESGFVCLRTSRNTRGGIHYDPDTLEPSDDQSKSFRKNFGNIGFTYDEARDGFIPPKPFDSWVLDEATCLWQAPIEYPADGGSYTWDETEGDWVEVPDEAVE